MEIKLKEKKFEFHFNKFTMKDNINIFNSKNNAWFLLKLNKKIIQKPNKYILKEGDIFKLGRIIFRVKEINLDKFQKEIERKKYIINYTNLNEKKNTTQIKVKKNICRICYNEEEEETNPLIQPCQCSGTMKYIHYKCLKQWIKTNSCIKIVKNKIYSIFNIKSFECELCKNKFPDIIEYNGKFFEISNYNCCYEKYIVLESLVLDGKNKRFFYVINLENDNLKLKIGRGKEIDILITDISISRIHCLLVRDKNNVYLDDCNSKFGTLILIQSPFLKMSNDLPLNIQIGRTFLHFELEKSFSFINCCTCEIYDNEYFYHQQNKQNFEYYKICIIKQERNIKENEKDKSINEEKNIIKDLYIGKSLQYKNTTICSLQISENNVNNDDDNVNKKRNMNIISIPFKSTDNQII